MLVAPKDGRSEHGLRAVRGSQRQTDGSVTGGNEAIHINEQQSTDAGAEA